ncbi:hypothetical protein N9992_00535 [bacterium]|nr:hypothetical protein [bacterium]
MAYIGKRPQDTFPATNAVTSTLIAENNITAREIATNTIVTSLIADNAVTAVKIAENVISSRELAANTVATGNIADNAVDGTKIAQNSILTRHIDDAQVTTDQLGADAVTAAKLADDAVVTANIVDANVTTAKIADNSVTAAKLNIAGNGTSGQAVLSDGDGSFSYGAGGKTTEEIQDIAGAMFTSNTETGITATYEDGDGTIDLVIGTLNQDTTGSAATLTTPRAIAVAGAVTGTANFDGSAGVSITTTLANNAVLTQHIDDNQVTADQIAAATITTTQIAANTIATGNVADNAIDGTKIASNSILTRHIDDDQVTGDQLADAIDVVTSVGVGGGSTNGVVISQGGIKIKNGGAKSYVDLYCEVSNAHYTRLEAAAHGAYSGNPTVTLPVTTGTLALTTDIHTTEELQDIIGAMFSSNTETGITATYQDADGTIDLVIGTLNQDTTGTAATVTGAAQTAITSVGTLTGLTTSGNVVVGGNLTVTGSTVTNSSTNTTIEDRLIELGTGTTGTPANDMGIVLERGDSANAFIGWDESADKFIVGTGTFTGASTGNLSITTGTIVANVEGNVTGNLTGTASAIADNSVTSAKIVNGTIVAADIANNAILTQHIDDNQVTADQIAAGTITTTQIAANTIATGNVADNAIDGTKIAQNSILTRHIDDGQVTTDQLGADAVTAAKLADDAVVTANIVNANVTTAKVADANITTAKIADNAITAAKLSIAGNGTAGQAILSDGDGTFSYGSSGKTSEEIQDIVGAMFSSNTETNITATYEDSDGTIDLVVPNTLTDVTELGTLTTLTVDSIKINGTQIGHTSDEDAMAIASNGVVTFTQIPVIPNDSIGADQLAANSVVSASIVNGSIVSADIAANTIATSNIADNAVDGSKIASNSILTRHIDDNQITGDQIADDIVLSGTGALRMPDGTTGQRPGSPAAGMFRYNTTEGKFEGYTDSWGEVGGGGSNGFLTDIFDGTTTPATDGSRTAFTMSQAVSDEKFVMVFIDGVYQAHAAYSVSGSTLTMADAPVAARTLTVHTISASVQGDGLNVDNFTGDGSDVTFTLSLNPTHENNTQVYVDGVYQFKNTYSVSGTTLTFSAAPPNGAGIEVMIHSQTTVNNAAGLAPGAISGLSNVSIAGADHLMLFDATDNTLKKGLASDLIEQLTTEQVQDVIGAMVTSNTESGITVAYDDSDGTLDFTVGTLNQNTTGNAATATTAGTVTTAAQTNITSLGTLTALTVDNITVDGSTISNGSGNITLDASGDIILDADGDDIKIAEGGNTIMEIKHESSSMDFLLNTGNDDFKFKGSDDGANITALQLDMSEAGSALFNSSVVAGTSARVTQVALTSSSNAVAWDSVAAGNAYHVTTENTTFSAPSNAVEGAIIQVEIAQGGTARTIAWNTVFEFAASTAPTVTATANKTDIFTFRYNGSVWQEIGRVQNLAQT